MAITIDILCNPQKIWYINILVANILVFFVSDILAINKIDIIFYKNGNIRKAIALRYIYCKKQQIYL